MTRELSLSEATEPLAAHESRVVLHDWLPKRLLAAQVCLALALAPWYSVFGLHIDWRTTFLLPLAHVALLAAWAYCRRYATHPRKFIFTDVLLATLLLLLITNIMSPAQYLAIAVHRPLIDDWLIRADAWFGIDVAALAHWTAGHPVISMLLSACYVTLMPQFLLPVIVLGLHERNRDGLWEYVFHFNFCLVITVAVLAIFPAECSYTHLGFTPTMDQARVIRQITALRAGTFHRIDFTDLDGLVSMPSFHAAGAFMVMWAVRHRRGLFLTLAVINTGLVAATFVTGVHYFVDVLGAVVLFAVSVAAFRAVSRARAGAPRLALVLRWGALPSPRAASTTMD